MADLKRSLSQHGIEISDWLLPPSGHPEEDTPDAVRVSGTGSFEPDAGDRLQEQIRPPALLPNALGAVLRWFALKLKDPEVAYYLVLLCVAASLIPSKTRLRISPHSTSKVPPILWGGIMGDASCGQSRIFSTLINPLRDLQVELHDRYQQQLEDCETALREHKKEQESNTTGDPPAQPTPVELCTSEYKEKVVAQILARQPDRGLLIEPDDLGIFLQDSGAGPGGRREDRIFWWRLYHGMALKRWEIGNVCTLVPHPTISVIGRTPRYTLRELWSKCKQYGKDLRSCFAWMRVPITSYTAPKENPPHALRRLLRDVYRRLQASPPLQHVLDEEGQQLWDDWSRELHDCILNERNHKIRLLLIDTLERAARIALVLHRLDAACIGAIPTVIVPASTLDRSMQFTMWLQWEAETLLFL